jgi:hypothetical protein
VWKGNVVNREWAAQAPARFKELLGSKAREKLARKKGWPGELAARLELLRRQGLEPEEQAALERAVLTDKYELKLGAWAVTPESLAKEPAKALALLEGKLPELWQEVSGETWLAQAAADWRAYWPRVDALGCGTSKEKSLPWIIGPTEQLTARATELLGKYCGSKDAKLDALWQKGDWRTAQCVALCAADGAQLLTERQKQLRAEEEEKEKRLQADLQWVKTVLHQPSAKEMQQAEAWLRQNDWDALDDPLAEVRLPENLTALAQQPEWRDLAERSDWSYREAVALSIRVSSKEFFRDKASMERERQAEEEARTVEVWKAEVEEAKKKAAENEKQRVLRLNEEQNASARSALKLKVIVYAVAIPLCIYVAIAFYETWMKAGIVEKVFAVVCITAAARFYLTWSNKN